MQFGKFCFLIGCRIFITFHRFCQKWIVLCFAFHSLHGLWVFMLIDAMIDEARDFIRVNGLEAFKQSLRAQRIEL